MYKICSFIKHYFFGITKICFHYKMGLGGCGGAMWYFVLPQMIWSQERFESQSLEHICDSHEDTW